MNYRGQKRGSKIPGATLCDACSLCVAGISRILAILDRVLCLWWIYFPSEMISCCQSAGYSKPDSVEGERDAQAPYWVVAERRRVAGGGVARGGHRPGAGGLGWRGRR